MAPKKSVTMSDEMRRLLATCGETRYSIAKTTGLTQSMLARFIAGHGIETKNLDILASHLGWSVQQATKDGE